MKKTLFAIIAFCLAASTTLAQVPFEPKLSEDHPEEEIAIIDHEDAEHGHIFVRINGELDDQGRTPVQIELENNSDVYDFLLLDHAWSKRELKKEWKIYFGKGFGESTLPVENIELDTYQNKLIARNSSKRYTFPDIFVEEGTTYECKIPIHLIKPKRHSRRKKIMQGIIECTIRVSIDNKDEMYDNLKREYDSLIIAFDEALAHEQFCTHPKHPLSFEAQTWDYTIANQHLKEQINRLLHNNNWPKSSKKFDQYQALLDSLNKMDVALEKYKNEKHYCGNERDKPTCRYCSLSYAEIYNKLNRIYGVKQKSEVIKEANSLYNCCKSHSKHAKQWNNSNPYKASIEEVYKKIKDY